MNGKDYHLVVSDLDGTLIPLGHQLSEHMLDVLQKVLDEGVSFVPATGRSLSFIPKSILSLQGLRYVISSKGAVIDDLIERKRVMTCLLEPSVAADAIRLLNTVEDAYVTVYANGDMYNSTRVPERLYNFSHKLDRFRLNPTEDLAGFVQAGDGVEKLFIYVPNEETRRRVQSVLGGIPGTELCISTTSYTLEMTSDKADKGRAIQWLRNYLGVPKEQVIGLADNFNDLPMMKEVGLAAVPSSAHETFQALADIIFPPCDQDGAADFLTEMFL